MLAILIVTMRSSRLSLAYIFRCVLIWDHAVSIVFPTCLVPWQWCVYVSCLCLLFLCSLVLESGRLGSPLPWANNCLQLHPKSGPGSRLLCILWCCLLSLWRCFILLTAFSPRSFSVSSSSIQWMLPAVKLLSLFQNTKCIFPVSYFISCYVLHLFQTLGFRE